MEGKPNLYNKLIVPLMSIKSLEEYDKRRWQEMESKRQAVKKEGEKVLLAALTEQARIHKELEEAQTIVAKMEEDYMTHFTKLEAEKKKALDAKNVTMVDVQSGKITLDELIKSGKKEGQLKEMAEAQALEELADAMTAIREKRVAVLVLERDLHYQRRIVFTMRLRPAIDLVKAYRDHADAMEIESGDLHKDRMESDVSVKQKEHELGLVAGKSLGSGKMWEGLTLEQARRLILDPVLPERLIPELMEELKKAGGKQAANHYPTPHGTWGTSGGGYQCEPYASARRDCQYVKRISGE